MHRNLLRIFFIILVISMNIGCDQSTKYLAKKYLKQSGTIQVVGDFFVLRYAENDGGFLSVFSSFPATVRFVILLALPSIALVALFVYLVGNPGLSRLNLFSFSCIVGGGISNVMLDRVFNNQFVIDFMNIGIGGIRTGIFNFADLSVMFGSIIVLLTAFAHGNTAEDTETN